MLENVKSVHEKYAECSPAAQDEDFIEDYDEPAPIEISFTAPPRLKDKIKNWFIEHRPSRKCLEGLLAILYDEGLDVPKSAATLIGKSEKIVVRNVMPGSYCHIGVEKQLKSFEFILQKYDKIDIDLNIDGIPIFKSSRVQLYPILAKIVNIKETINPFPVGVYIGYKKPASIDDFLKDLVDEVKALESKVLLDGKFVKINFRSLICDTPAKSFVCGIPGHSSSHGCSKCTQVAKRVNDTLTYSTVSGTLITDEDFASRKYPKHHYKSFQTKETPLEQIGFKMISQIPLDPMHLVDLGVMRKMLIRIINRRTENKTPKSHIDKISNELVKMQKFFPKEFPRKPRSLEDIHNWKATEFHQFLAYTGPLVLLNNVHHDIYYEFLLLHCAYRLLSSPREVTQYLEQAQGLLELFVENFPVVFGEGSVSFNVHSLLHLTSCAEQYGPLSSFSAYDFENKLQLLKKYVQKPSQILQQIVNRDKIQPVLKKIKNGRKFLGNRVSGIHINDCFFSEKSPNNFCMVKSETPIKIEKFLSGGNNSFESRRLLDLDNFYEEPVISGDLGIYKSKLVLGEKEHFCIGDIECKLLCLPFGSNFLLIPILHSCT